MKVNEKSTQKKPYFFALSHINDYNFNTYKNIFEKKLKNIRKIHSVI